MIEGDREWYWYRHSGLTVRSQIALPQWTRFALAHGEKSDVEIIRDSAEPVASRDEAASHWNGRALQFTVDEVARFVISDGTQIAVSAWPQVPDDRIAPYLLASAWAALGYQRGYTLLHGSAVKMAGGAVMFCGFQEHGKSTMAAALAQQGHALLADDLARIEAPDPARIPLVHPSATRMKLWSEAMHHFGWQTRGCGRDHLREEKFHIEAPVATSREPEALRALVILEWGEAVSIDRLYGSDAVSAAIIASCFRPEMLAAMGQMPREAARIAAVVSAVPVVRLTRPRDLAQIGQVCDAVRSLFGESPSD